MYQNRIRKIFELYQVFMYDILYQNDKIFMMIFELNQILVLQNVLTLLWYWYMLNELLRKNWLYSPFIIFWDFVYFIYSYGMVFTLSSINWVAYIFVIQQNVFILIVTYCCKNIFIHAFCFFMFTSIY